MLNRSSFRYYRRIQLIWAWNWCDKFREKKVWLNKVNSNYVKSVVGNFTLQVVVCLIVFVVSLWFTWGFKDCTVLWYANMRNFWLGEILNYGFRLWVVKESLFLWDYLLESDWISLFVYSSFTQPDIYTALLNVYGGLVQCRIVLGSTRTMLGFKLVCEKIMKFLGTKLTTIWFPKYSIIKDLTKYVAVYVYTSYEVVLAT